VEGLGIKADMQQDITGLTVAPQISLHFSYTFRRDSLVTTATRLLHNRRVGVRMSEF
jgi:hypothetical protein